MEDGVGMEEWNGNCSLTEARARKALELIW